MTVRRRALVLALALAGCATPPREAGVDYSGRMSVRIEDGRSESASFELRGSDVAGQLDLSSPLGTLVARARWQPGSAVLTRSQSDQTYPDLDTLTRELLGESLPVAALFDWLRGRPWSGAPNRAQDNGFEQLDWLVDTSAAARGSIVAVRQRPPSVTVRIRLDGPP